MTFEEGLILEGTYGQIKYLLKYTAHLAENLDNRAVEIRYQTVLFIWLFFCLTFLLPESG